MKIIVTTLIIAVLLMSYLETKTKEQELKNKQMLEMADKMQQQLLLKEAKKMNEELGDNNEEILNPDENTQYPQQEQNPNLIAQEEQYQPEPVAVEPTGDLRTDASNKASQGDFSGALNDYIELYNQTNFREDLMNIGEMSMIIGQKQPLKDILEQHLRAHPEDAGELQKYSSFVNEQY